MAPATSNPLTTEQHAELQQLLAQVLPGAFLVATEGGKGRVKKLHLFVDTLPGITIEQCAKLNRQLREPLENAKIITAEHELHISSPGVGRPLQVPQQYTQNIGRTLKLRLTNGQELTGTLRAFEGEALLLELTRKNPTTKKRETLTETIALSQLAQATVEISFK